MVARPSELIEPILTPGKGHYSQNSIPASFTSNQALIAGVAALYVRDGDTIADVTYGPGVFWKSTDCRRFRLLASDLYPHGAGVARVDCRQLPYMDASIDVVVLDPPYAHHASRHLTGRRYDRLRTTHNMTHDQIINDLYRPAMIEAKRVLRRGGLLWVKCKDEIESGKQRRSDFEIFEIAIRELGFEDQDRFTLRGRPVNANRWSKQLHARKTDSYLWVFRRRS